MPRKLLAALAALLFFATFSAHAAWQWQSTGTVVQDDDPRSCCGGVVIPSPSGLAVGDDVILVVSYRFGHNSVWSTPSGWTLLASNNELVAFCRKADSALVSAGSQQVIGPTAGNSMGVMLRFTGGPANCAPHATSTKANHGAVQDVATNALTITQPNTLVLAIGLFNWTGGEMGVNSYPGGATNRVSASTTFTTNKFSLLVGSHVQTSATNIPVDLIDLVTTNTALSLSMIISIPAGTADPTAAPTGVAATPVGTASPSTTLRVTWNAAANAHHYRVRYKRAVDSSYTSISTQFTSLTTDVTGLSPATLYDVQVGSANSSESVLIWPSAATQGTTQSLATSQINWHTGHYALLTPIMYNGSVSYAKDNFHLPLIDNQICNIPEWKGVELYMTWGAYETAEYDYSQGREIVQEYLDHLSACGKRLMLNIVFANYNGSTCTNQLPAYIINGANYGTTVGNSSGRELCYSRFWQQATMDKYIDVMEDIGAQFGDHPNFEMIFFWELLAPGIATGTDGWSASAMATQAIRWLQATRAAMPKQQVRLGVNWWSTDAGIVPLLEACRQNACSWGGPDVSTTTPIQANFVYRGYLRNSSGTWVQSGTDYSGIIPMIGQTEWWRKVSASDTWAYANSDYVDDGVPVPNQKPSYFNWAVNTWDTGTSWHWSTSVRPFVETTIDGAINYTTCPTAFPSCKTD